MTREQRYELLQGLCDELNEAERQLYKAIADVDKVRELAGGEAAKACQHLYNFASPNACILCGDDPESCRVVERQEKNS